MALATARLELVMDSSQIVFCSAAQLLQRKWGTHQSFFRTIFWSQLVRMSGYLVQAIIITGRDLSSRLVCTRWMLELVPCIKRVHKRGLQIISWCIRLEYNMNLGIYRSIFRGSADRYNINRFVKAASTGMARRYFIKPWPLVTYNQSLLRIENDARLLESRSVHVTFLFVCWANTLLSSISNRYFLTSTTPLHGHLYHYSSCLRRLAPLVGHQHVGLRYMSVMFSIRLLKKALVFSEMDALKVGRLCPLHPLSSSPFNTFVVTIPWNWCMMGH